MSFIFYLLGRFTPAEWGNPYPCVVEPNRLWNQFSLSNSFFFSFGGLSQQGSDVAPVAVSTR